MTNPASFGCWAVCLSLCSKFQMPVGVVGSLFIGNTWARCFQYRNAPPRVPLRGRERGETLFPMLYASRCYSVFHFNTQHSSRYFLIHAYTTGLLTATLRSIIWTTSCFCCCNVCCMYYLLQPLVFLPWF